MIALAAQDEGWCGHVREIILDKINEASIKGGLPQRQYHPILTIILMVEGHRWAHGVFK